MFKVTCVTVDEETVTLKIEGRIVGPWVDELKRECKKCLATQSKLVIDLSGVSFIDGRGVKALKSIVGDRTRLTGYSLFLSGLLNE